MHGLGYASALGHKPTHREKCTFRFRECTSSLTFTFNGPRLVKPTNWWHIDCTTILARAIQAGRRAGRCRSGRNASNGGDLRLSRNLWRRRTNVRTVGMISSCFIRAKRAHLDLVRPDRTAKLVQCAAPPEYDGTYIRRNPSRQTRPHIEYPCEIVFDQNYPRGIQTLR